MTKENRMTKYWPHGIAAVVVVLVVLAYLLGYFEPAAPAAS